MLTLPVFHLDLTDNRSKRMHHRSCIQGGEILRVCCYVRRKTYLFTTVGLEIFQNSRLPICMTYDA